MLFWPWTIPGEAAVLALDEHARVQEPVQQEPRLTFGEAERRDGFQPLGIGQVEGPTVRFKRQHHSDQLLRDSRVSSTATADRASN